MTDWWALALGPLGALVIALTAALYSARELRRVQAERVDRLEQMLANRRTECEQLRGQLQAEHANRLEDAKTTTRTLLDLNDRIHKTLDGLEALTRATGRTRPSPP